jgi:hypothetical protein
MHWRCMPYFDPEELERLYAAGARQYAQSRADEIDDVWPEVSSSYSLDDSTHASSENSPRRVLSEAALILAIAGLAAIAAGLLVHALS